jgi:phosphonate dehydrogenase
MRAGQMNASARPRVVVTSWVHDEVLDLLSRGCEVVANPGREPWTRAEILERAAEAEAMMAFMTDAVDEDFLAACPRLRVVGCALKGYDNFDVEACTRRGVWVTIVPDLLTDPTAELTVGLMIGLARNVLSGDRVVRGGDFRGWRPRLYGGTVNGATVGIVGMGAVGRAVARRLAGFGCRILYHDARPLPPAEEAALGASPADLGDLLSRSDFVVAALPLLPSTLHRIGAAEIARMRPGAYLVNPSRGSVVDEAAVVAALESGRLAGYAADAFEMEDWARPDRPHAVPEGLLRNPDRTLLTPHLGSAVDPVRREIAMEAARNVLAALAGERPPGAVNEPVRDLAEPAAGR